VSNVIFAETKPPPASAAALGILVLDAESGERETLVTSLRLLRHMVRGVARTDEGKLETGLQHLDILVVSSDRLETDALDFARWVRHERPDTGIIAVTSRLRLEDRLAGYRSGIDLFLNRPTSTEELEAALRTLSKRAYPKVTPRANTSSGVTLNTATLQLLGSSAAVDISDTESSVLVALTNCSTQRLDSANLIEAAGKPLSKSTLEVLIVRLRKKLAQAGAAAPTIKSIRGVGYQLCVPVRVQPFVSNASSNQKELT